MTILYRGMRPDQSQKPVCGETATVLGVRPKDIPMENGIVRPNTGGMSVTCDDPNMLPEHRKPEAIGGTARNLMIFYIEESQLPDDLVARQDQPIEIPSHRSVEPVRPCPYVNYLASLHGTKDHWTAMP